jgi:Mor family transcriptional regulator
MITNQDIFEEFVNFCQNNSIEEIVKEYGGGTIYIPSYKSIGRDKDIYTLYKNGTSIKQLSKKFSLSESRIRTILRSFTKAS